MRNLLCIAAMATAIVGCKETKKETTIESETITVEAVEAAEWKVLFDGTSMDGWHGYLKEGVDTSAWKLEDGAMVFYPPAERNGQSFNIVTDDVYTDFVLELEWKISEAGNSGIFWGISEDVAYGQPYETGPEIQVLDDLKHPDAKVGERTHTAGALYDMIAPSSSVVKPVGEWNKVQITINHKTNAGLVVLNGTEIVSFPVEGEAWDAMVAKSKFATWEGFGKFKTGKIGLQDHGDVVAYRNIRIKEL